MACPLLKKHGYVDVMFLCCFDKRYGEGFDLLGDTGGRNGDAWYVYVVNL